MGECEPTPAQTARANYKMRTLYAAMKERDEDRKIKREQAATITQLKRDNRQLEGDVAAGERRAQVLKGQRDAAREGRVEKAAIAACNRKDARTAEACVRQSTTQAEFKLQRLREAVAREQKATRAAELELEAERTELEAERAGRQAEREASDQHVTRLQASLDQTKSDLAELQAVVRGSKGRGKAGLKARLKKVEGPEASIRKTISHWQKELGLPRSRQIPARRLPATYDTGDHIYRDQVRHVAAVCKGRNPVVIANALRRNGQIEAVMATPPFQPALKTKIEGVLKVIQEHWSPRHALFVMSEVHTSRSEFDTLRHLLSFVYNRSKDIYEKLVVWVNPHDPADTLASPTVASRWPREAERDLVYGRVGACASNDGLYCGRVDMDKGLRELVEHYWDALDPRVRDLEIPLVVIVTGDATGGWRGASVTHAEAALGSWAKGKGQSRLTVLPLYIMEGDDSATNLRNRAAPSAEAYNKLKRKGTITVTIKGKPITLPLTLLVSADFQFHKAALNMSKYRSAIWTMDDEDVWYRLPEKKAVTWADCLAFFKEIGSELKTLKDICELNHWSYEYLMGEPFVEFGCRCCSFKSGTQQQWLAKWEAHCQLDEAARKAADLEQSRDHYRHYFGPPLYHQPAIDFSADVLHLIFINKFATRFELTILNYIFEYPPECRRPFETYINAIGIPLKVVKAQSVQEMKQALTGRDAKNMIAKALDHLPTLLEFAHAGADAVQEELEAEDAPPPPRPRADADNEFDWDSGGEDDDGDEDAAAAASADAGDFDLDAHGVDSLPIILKMAKAWDSFVGLAFATRPFERDDSEYREAIAVETFNAAALDSAWTKKLQPNASSACSLVAMRVVTEQMVVHGDPNRRGADHSESFGAQIKDGLHRRTLRRRLGKAAMEHKRRKGAGGKTWTQRPLSVSRVMQVFRHVSVREALLRDAASERYLQRQHVRVTSTGFATAASACGECDDDDRALPASVYEKMREAQEEGGEIPAV